MIQTSDLDIHTMTIESVQHPCMSWVTEVKCRPLQICFEILKVYFLSPPVQIARGGGCAHIHHCPSVYPNLTKKYMKKATKQNLLFPMDQGQANIVILAGGLPPTSAAGCTFFYKFTTDCRHSVCELMK